MLEPADIIALSGELAAGKTVLARSLIRSHLNIPTETVVSPTFTLVQPYEGGAFPILHADLYRLASADEVTALGLFEEEETRALVIEWPEILSDHSALQGDGVLWLQLCHVVDQPEIREVKMLRVGGKWIPRLTKLGKVLQS